MAYSTPQQVRQALIPSGDGSVPGTPSNTAADLTDVMLADQIAEADALIDGYIAKFYITPVESPTPQPIASWSRDIAAYLATCTFRGSMDFTDNDPVARRYLAVMEALKDVSRGQLQLNLPGRGDDGARQGSAGNVINPYQGDLWTPDDFSIGQAQGSANSDGSWRPPFWPGY